MPPWLADTAKIEERLYADAARWTAEYGNNREIGWSHPGYLTPAWAMSDRLPPLSPPSLTDYLANGGQFCDPPVKTWTKTLLVNKASLHVETVKQFGAELEDWYRKKFKHEFARALVDNESAVLVGPRLWWSREFPDMIYVGAAMIVDGTRWSLPPTTMPYPE